ncbi:MAG: mechanosensitive ion channel [Cyanobacteria bacterium P01_H01_bin.119]
MNIFDSSGLGLLPTLAAPQMVGQTNSASALTEEFGRQLGQFLPGLLLALVYLIVGWLVATVSASLVKGILNRTNLDDRIANAVLGQDQGTDVPVEQWAASLVYWIILTFTLVASLQRLGLEEVSAPLNNFLQEIFAYLPRIGGAIALLAIAWAIATIVKLLVTRGLSRFNLDDQLASQMGTADGRSPVLVNETVGDVLYWFIFLLFLPLVLSALSLPGLLTPVEGLIDQFLTAIPKILTAGLVLVIGWFVAKIVRTIVTNFLVATGIDQVGERVGLSATASQGVVLSTLVGNIVYILILIPVAIVALNELDLQAISDPAVNMLEQVLAVIPQILLAGLVVLAAYFVGKFVADLVTGLLASIGFDNVFAVLGLPELNTSAPADEDPEAATPATTVQTPGKTPSEIVGIIVLVGIVLFGLVTATEVLQFAQLTDIVSAILQVSAQVLSGVIVFAIGLYAANLAFRAIQSTGSGQAQVLAQAARIAIIALVGAMALQQMGVATNIVNLAFGLLLGAVAVAIAIAFGLGGRDIASEQIREWLEAFKRR